MNQMFSTTEIQMLTDENLEAAHRDAFDYLDRLLKEMSQRRATENKRRDENATELLAALEAVLRTGLNGGNNVRLSLMAASCNALDESDLKRAEQSEAAVEIARAAIAKAKGEA